MSLVKTVELKILASAGDAQAQLDALDARAKDLDGNAIKMKFRVDDTEGKAQLDAIKARAKTMGFEDVRVRVRIDGAGRAIAELSAVKHEMDSVDRHGLMNRIGGLFGSAGGGIPGQVGLPFLGPVGLPVIAAAIPAVGALATEVVAVAAGFAAAGTGAGAFALLAMPAVKKVEAAYHSLGAAQQKYAAAQAKEAADPTKTNKTALAAAALNLQLAHQAISKMPASEQAAIKGISGLAAGFGKLSRAFEPQAFKVFSSGLKLVSNLLPHVTPFANTFATGLDKLLQQAGKFTQSKGFSGWLKQFHSLEGPAIGSIGAGIGKVATSVGKLLTIMSGKDVAHAINIGFGAIAGTINVVTSALHRFMQNWDGMSAAAAKGAHAVAGAFSAIVSGAVSMQRGINHVFAGAAGWLVSAGKSVVMGLVHGIESMAGSVLSAIGHIASLIPSGFSKLLHIFSPSRVMHGLGQQTIQGLILGLQGGQAAVAAAAAAIASTVVKPFVSAAITKAAARLEAMAPSSMTAWLKHDNTRLQILANQRAILEKQLQAAEQVAQQEISNNSIMNAAGAVANGPAAPVATSDVIAGMQQQLAAVTQFRQAIQQLKREGLNATSLSQIIQSGSGQGLPVAQALTSGGKQAIAQVNSLQKQLRAEAGKLGDAAAAPMYTAGQQAAQGLAQGIRSQIGAVDNAMKQLAQSMVAAVKAALKSHSPSLVMADVGMSIPQGVALGITRASHLAVGASSRLAASTVQPWAGTGGRSAQGGGDVHVHFHGVFTGDKYGTAQQVHQLMRDYKRNRGGASLGLA